MLISFWLCLFIIKLYSRNDIFKNIFYFAILSKCQLPFLIFKTNTVTCTYLKLEEKSKANLGLCHRSMMDLFNENSSLRKVFIFANSFIIVLLQGLDSFEASVSFHFALQIIWLVSIWNETPGQNGFNTPDTGLKYVHL